MARESIGRTFLALSALLTVAMMTNRTDAAGPGSVNGAVQATSLRQNDDCITLHLEPAGILRLQVWSDSIIRVITAPGNELPTLQSLAVIAKPSPTKWDLEESPEYIGIATGQLSARVDKKTGAVTFLDRKGNTLLKEANDGREVAPIPPPAPDTPAATQPFLQGTLVRQSFILPPDEGLYGLGDRKGEFPNMLKERTFNVVFVTENHGQGAAITEHPDQTVKYSGQSISVKATQ